MIYFVIPSSPVEVRLFAYFFCRSSPNFLLTVSNNKGALALLLLYWIHSILAVMSPSVVIATYIISLIIILLLIDFHMARYNISIPYRQQNYIRYELSDRNFSIIIMCVVMRLMYRTSFCYRYSSSTVQNLFALTLYNYTTKLLKSSR